MDNTLHPDTTTFLEFIESFNLRSHTNFATHISNHYLDLTLIEHGSTVISKIDRGDLFSDHHFVDLKLAVSHPISKPIMIKYRKLRGIDDELFCKDLAESLAEVYDPVDNVSSLVDGYNKSLAQVLDKHAPVKSKTVRKTHTQPWFTNSIKNEIHIRCMKEKIYLKDPTDYNYMAYYQYRHVANLTKTAKCKYYHDKITEHKYDNRAIYTIVNALLFRKEPTPLPDWENPKELAEGFSKLYMVKIANIMQVLKSSSETTSGHSYVETDYATDQRLYIFSPVFMDEIIQLIKESPSKYCELDPLPTDLIKQHIGVIAPSIANIANASTQQECVPESLKQAILRPLIKKMDMEIKFPSFHPVSNLTFLSETIERVIQGKLLKYVESTGNEEILQSAYKANHSTETALLEVRTDILDAIQNKEVTCLYFWTSVQHLTPLIIFSS